MSKSLRILYALGPENIIEAYKYWNKGQDAPSQVSVTFSSQFYEVCQTLDAQGYAIAQSSKQELIKDERFIIEHRQVPLPAASGIVYHLRQIWYGLHLLTSALRFRANVAVIDSGTTYWFVLSLFSWLGIKVIPSLHCLLWCKYLPLRLVDKLNLTLSRSLFRSDCKAILAASHDVAEQVSQLTAGKNQPTFEFFSTYRRTDFTNLASSSEQQRPFYVLFAGRVEQNKGVFDLLEIAKHFSNQVQNNIIFDICGEGSALEALGLEAKQAGICDSFICHGYLSKLQMKEMFERSHVVIVPTRTEFTEGFNRVVCESILSSRPVVTSSVCPALFYVQDAVVEVPPNDVQAYSDALLRLYSDRQFYEQKKQACLMVQEQFYNPLKSWGFVLKSILLTIIDEQKQKVNYNS